MMKKGFTTITFRQKTIEEIVEIAVRAGCDGIEWGGDLHIPPGDFKAADRVRTLCAESGIEIFSYGSYFLHRLTNKNAEDVVQTAVRLGAPLIRVWAGEHSPELVTPLEYDDIVQNLRKITNAAKKVNIRTALEYHRNSLTENIESALKLLKDVPDLECYWQPNPEISFEEQLFEIEALSRKIAAFHVFNWTFENGKNVRHLLKDAKEKWKQYIKKANEQACFNLILEFVKDDSEESFFSDFEALKEISGEI